MTLFVLLICAAVTSVVYRVLTHHHLEQGLALFIGLPVLLGTIIAFSTEPRSVFGMILKVTALVLCVVAPLLGEGAICIAMAAPIIFGILGLAALISLSLQRYLDRKRIGCLGVLVALSPMLWEAQSKPTGWQDLRPLDRVEDSQILPASTEAVWAALAQPPADLSAAPIPAFMRLRLRAGERWVRISNGQHGLALGTRWQVRFDNDQYEATVIAVEPEKRVRFAIREEAGGAGERIGLWLRFSEVEWQVEAVPGGTRLTQRTFYQRLLDPGFYFAPLERAGVHAMHRYTLGLYSKTIATAPR
jgi:hypothetical protein